MQKLIQGIHHFQNNVFGSKRDLYDRLTKGQYPTALLLTCADSRIDPQQFTQSDPGDLFVLRNAGNIVPPYPEVGGEIASIEFAVKVLRIRDIIICGHSHCGAMNGLFAPPSQAKELPSLFHWLRHARRTADIVKQNYGHVKDPQKLQMITTAENVIVQIENLKSHPFIEDQLSAGELRLHGWVYKFETGEVFYYDTEIEQFLPLTQQGGVVDEEAIPSLALR